MFSPAEQDSHNTDCLPKSSAREVLRYLPISYASSRRTAPQDVFWTTLFLLSTKGMIPQTHNHVVFLGAEIISAERGRCGRSTVRSPERTVGFLSGGEQQVGFLFPEWSSPILHFFPYVVHSGRRTSLRESSSREHLLLER